MDPDTLVEDKRRGLRIEKPRAWASHPSFRSSCSTHRRVGSHGAIRQRTSPPLGSSRGTVEVFALALTNGLRKGVTARDILSSAEPGRCLPMNRSQFEQERV